MTTNARPTHKPLRILVWSWNRRGAGATFTADIIKILAARTDLDITAHIAAGNEVIDQIRATRNITLYETLTYNSVKEFAFATLALFGKRRAFANILRNGEFDIVFSPMGHLWTPFFCDLIQKNGARYIAALHDAQPHPGERQPLWRWRRQREINCAHHILTFSKAIAEKISTDYAVPTSKISTIPLPLPTLPISNEATRAPPTQQWRFMFFGRFMKYKGLGLLLDAWQNLTEQRKDIHLTLAGSGDLSEWQEKINTLSNITIINRWIENDEIAPILNNSDIVVLPYIEASQSGVTPYTSALGIPVIATPVGGLQEQVIHNQTGLITENITSAAIAKAMDALAEDALYCKIAAATRSACQALTHTAQGEAYSKLFHKIAHDKTARP